MSLTTEQVWEELERSYFGVLGFVTFAGRPRTVGVCYAVGGRALFISTDRDSWKVRHMSANPHVSMTVTIPKRVPFLPFIKVPAATITFKGVAEVLEVDDIDPAVFRELPMGNEKDLEVLAATAVIRVVPIGDFVTYGIAMPLIQMSKHEAAHGRAACGTDREASAILHG